MLYTNSLPGSGKTTHLIKQIKEEVDEKFILVCPTTEHMQEVYDKLNINSRKSIGVMITSGYHNRVVDQLMFAARNGERVIMITYACLMLIDRKNAKKLREYNLIIDESFNIATFKNYQLERCLQKGGFLDRIVGYKPFFDDDPDFCRLFIKDHDELAEYIKYPDTIDTLTNKETTEFLNSINDDRFIVIANRQDHSRQANFTVGTFYNVNLLKYYKSVHLYSAFFEYTSLYNFLEFFYDLKQFEIDARSMDHRLEKLYIYALIEDRRYSKRVRDTCTVKPKNVLGKALTITGYKEAVKRADIRFKDCIDISNLDDDNDDVLGTSVKAKCHGINKHRDKTAISVVGAYNAAPEVRTFLEKLYGENYCQWTEGNIIDGIQRIMRTNLRDWDSDKEVHALVNDMDSANMIKKLLKHPKIKRHKLADEYVVVGPEKTKSLEGFYKNGKPKLTEEEKREKKRLLNQKLYEKRQKSDLNNQDV